MSRFFNAAVGAIATYATTASNVLNTQLPAPALDISPAQAAQINLLKTTLIDLEKLNEQN